MKIKSFLKKMVSFKMENLIEEYKNNKQDRKEYTADIWNIINNKYHKKNEIVNIFAGSMLVLFIILTISIIFKIEVLILITQLSHIDSTKFMN